MSSGKEAEFNNNKAPIEQDAPPGYEGNQESSSAAPTYEESNAGPSNQAQPQVYEKLDSKKPTVESPFNFPSDPAPSYDAAASSSSNTFQKAIAIPQIKPDSASPFLPAYPPSLLGHGITADSWRSFLDTLSAFLNAKVSDRAIAHAADVGKHVGNVPVSFGKGTINHAKSVGRHIKDNAAKGNVIGTAFSVVGGAISLPVGTAARAVGAIVSLPGTTIAAAVKKPQTPRSRASAYIGAANKDWFASRGLFAQLVDTVEFSVMLGIAPEQIIDSVNGTKGHAAEQLYDLTPYIADAEVQTSTALEIGATSLWLVLTTSESIL